MIKEVKYMTPAQTNHDVMVMLIAMTSRLVSAVNELIRRQNLIFIAFKKSDLLDEDPPEYDPNVESEAIADMRKMVSDAQDRMSQILRPGPGSFHLPGSKPNTGGLAQ